MVSGKEVPLKIILTGAQGFVGRYYLENSKYTSSIKPVSVRYENCEKLDVTSADIVIHAGAMVHQMKRMNPDEFFQSNFRLTEKLALKAKANGIKHFIFLSSIKVFGDHNVISRQISSIDRPTPTDPYGKSKHLAEEALLSLSDKNFKVTILRLPLIFDLKAKGNIASMIKMAKKTGFLPFAGINNSRSFLTLNHLAFILDQVVEKTIEGTFLIYEKENWSTSKMAEAIIEGKDIKAKNFKLPVFFTWPIKIFFPSVYYRIWGSITLQDHEYERMFYLL